MFGPMIWAECLDFEESSYGQLLRSLSPDYKKSSCKANSSPTELSLPKHT